MKKIRVYCICILVMILISGCTMNSEHSSRSDTEIIDGEATDTTIGITTSDTTVILEEESRSNPIEEFMISNNHIHVIDTLMVDLDNDLDIESFLVSEGLDDNRLRLWQILDDGTGEVLLEANGLDYIPVEVVNRGDEKHIAFMGHYEPSNTQLWVIRMEDNQPNIIFEFMADWEIRIIPKGFQMVWKEYNEADVGGYDLVGENFYWSDSDMKYSCLME